MRGRLLWLLTLLLLTSACAVQPPGPGHGQPPVGNPPPAVQCQADTTFQVSFCVDLSLFPNPERGFHDDVNLAESIPISVSQPHVTLVRGLVRLDAWRQADLPASLLAGLEDGFAEVRAAGLKVVPRFAYNAGNAPDTSVDWVLSHIDQLTPVLQRNSDVIAVLHAGFIGRWGEWHHSTNDLTSPANKQAIGQALFRALPGDRMLQIRTPYHIRQVLGSQALFEPGQAFGDSDQARIGFLNDCFLASADDAGTYDNDSDRQYARAMATFTATGGETCSIAATPASRQDCPNALTELDDYHWDYLNLEFYRPVLNRWRNQGCFDEIARLLGYRYELLGASIENGVTGPLLTIGIRNTGFGKLYNPRPLTLLLVDGMDVHSVTLAEDARLVLPLSGETINRLTFTLSDLPPGNWNLELALPDAAPSLRGNPAYAIRLASLDASGNSVWNGVRGSNRLGLELTVAPD